MARKKTKNHYFTQVHEDAIIEYCSTMDLKRRDVLYRTYIGPVFDEMVDKIVFTYKFTSLPNIDSLREDCKDWLVTILSKYDPNRGSKAFAYFSVVTKNWFIAQVKKHAKKMKREVYLDDCLAGDSTASVNQLTTENTYLEDRNKEEFFSHLYNNIEKWKKIPSLKPNEIKTLQAIEILFNDAEQIEIFNKKAIYLYIREITGLNTKQVANSLNKIRRRYLEFKKEWVK